MKLIKLHYDLDFKVFGEMPHVSQLVYRKLRWELTRGTQPQDFLNGSSYEPGAELL